jgi:hypothetical protein
VKYFSVSEIYFILEKKSTIFRSFNKNLIFLEVTIRERYLKLKQASAISYEASNK